MTNVEEEKQPLFPLGQVVATPAALAAITEAGQDPLTFLERHVTGDYGDLPEEDIKENEFSLEHGFRIFSAYHTAEGVKFYIITEYDRSVTTILLPSEY